MKRGLKGILQSGLNFNKIVDEQGETKERRTKSHKELRRERQATIVKSLETYESDESKGKSQTMQEFDVVEESDAKKRFSILRTSPTKKRRT